MLVLLTFTLGLIIWIVLWAVGAKGLDAFLVTIGLTVVAAAAHMVVSLTSSDADKQQS
jgi:hypothetical protein